MPTYSIKGPDGKTYSLEGPSGATREQVIQEINRQSQQPQQPTDFAANPRQLKDGEGSDFLRGIGQYTDQYGGIMGGAKMLAGKATGSDSLIESGLKQYKKSEADVGKRGVKKTDSFTGALDEGLGAVLTEFIPYIAGQGVGMIGEAFLTAGAGALIGGSAAPGVGAVPGAVGGFLSRKFVKDGILDEAKKMSGDVKKQFLRNEVAKQLATQEGRDVIKKGYSKLGRTGGLTYMAGKFGAGEVTGRAVDEALAANPDSTDQLEIIKGLNTGKLAALSAGHALADYFFLKIGLNSLDAMPAGQASRMAAIFRNIGVTGLKEAPIEAVQTVLEREGANLPLADKEALEEYINAAAAGFFMPIIPATVGGIRAPLAGQPTDTTPGEPTPREPTTDKAPEAAVETEVDPTSSSVGAAPIDAEVDVDTTEVTETDTEVDDRQGDLFGTEVTETDTDATEVTETEATPVVALEDAAQEAGPMMYEKGPKLHDEFTKENNIDHGGAKSIGPHAEKNFTLNDGKAKQEKRGNDPSKITSGGSKSKGPHTEGHKGAVGHKHSGEESLIQRELRLARIKKDKNKTQRVISPEEQAEIKATTKAQEERFKNRNT